MALNIADDIKSYVQTIYDGATLVARENMVLPLLVQTWGDRSGTAIRSRSEYGTATVRQVTDADDLTSQAVTPSVSNSLTPYEYGAQAFVTDTLIETDPFQARSDISMELGLAFAQAVQTKIAAQFSSLTGGTVGSAGGTITWAQVMEAKAYLRQQMAPEPHALILHPGQWYHLGTAAPVANTASTDLGNAVLQRFFIGQVLGLQVYLCNDITAGTAAYGAAFSAPAIGYDVRRAYRLEPERDASRRGWELNASSLYAAGVWRPKWGVQIIATSNMP